MNINFIDLETYGFLVIPRFLNEEELSTILTIHTKVLENYNLNGSSNKNYKILREIVPNSVHDKIKLLLTDINKNTRLKTNILTHSNADYLDNSLVKFDWHQDHETYFKWQNAHDVLNFWIAISKPVSTESGLDIIPQNVLKNENLTIFNEHILNKGAKDFKTDNTTTVMYDSETGIKTILPFNIDTLKVSPITSAGDLILLRGDVIHKSQSPTTPRLAISLRAVDSNYVITKEKFFSGSNHKQSMIQSNIRSYNPFIETYNNKDVVTIGEILNYSHIK